MTERQWVTDRAKLVYLRFKPAHLSLRNRLRVAWAILWGRPQLYPVEAQPPLLEVVRVDRYGNLPLEDQRCLEDQPLS